jgi:polysaccharide biosynthesis transport protein
MREREDLMDSEQTSLSIGQVLGLLRRRGPLMLLCCIAAAGAAYGYSKHKPKKYTATAAVSFVANPLSQQIAGLSAISNSGNLAAEQASNLERVTLGNTAATTATLLGHRLTERKVSESVSVSARGESNVVGVTVSWSSPGVAALIANTYTRQFVKEQQSANRRFFASALHVVRKQLARLSPTQRVGNDGVVLQQRASTLGLLVELGYNNAQVAGEASVPSSPSSPNNKRNTLLGAVLGLILGLGVAVLLERMDRRIRDPKDLETIYGLPMLGVVPNSSALSRSTRHDGSGGAWALPAAEAEAFSLIRAHLRFFNVDRDVRTVVITSPAPGDGKTTIAHHLAEAAARLGSLVLLLEVDLRQPTLAQQLDIQSGPGLADVLIGAVSMNEATQSVDLQAPPGKGARGRTLDVLAAGTAPPNPGELLESRAMDAVLERAKSAYDLVVIDTPPLTAVSDAFPLLTKVDGVVIVGWVGRSRRDAAEGLHQVLASSAAPLLGVIANGSKLGGPGVYAYARDGKSSSAVASANGASPSEELIPTAKA